MEPGAKPGFLLIVNHQKLMKKSVLKFPRTNISCEFLIEKGLLKKIPKILKEREYSKDYILLTDRRVEELYGIALQKTIQRAGLRCPLISVLPGERSKSRKVKERLEDAILQQGHGRTSILIALGGGVVGDLGGFVASTFLRGIPYIQVPTTLLSMADSSIGGKTAINHPLGKNLIGAFHQPLAIFIDITTLTTLPERDYRAGLAEIIKYGVILSKSLFSYLEKNHQSLKKRKFGVLEKVVEKCVRLKAKIVKKDEREEGLRKLLNCGHTIGHAVEHLSSYKLLHGEAVSIGLAVESSMSHRMGYLNQPSLERIRSILQIFDLPVCLPKNIQPQDILKVAEHDKKTSLGQIKYVLPASIGVAVNEKDAAIPVSRKIVMQAFQDCTHKKQM
jgi:3-dehydroquinate synthase